MKVCLGIISIGRTYTEEFERLFKPSVLSYCQKYGYDLKVFTNFLDPNHTHPDTISFQKCLVPTFLMDYDLVVVLDADIYIESAAPAIHFHELNGKIGIVDEVSQTSPAGYQKMIDIGFADRAEKYYKLAGFELATPHILNTGVMICDPKVHAQYLKGIYEKYVDKSVGHPRKFHYEQACIGYEMQIGQMYTLIGNAWNFIFVHSQITKEPVISYFLHLAGIRGSEREQTLARHTFKSGLRWGIKK
jgi:hypothetical protein